MATTILSIKYIIEEIRGVVRHPSDESGMTLAFMSAILIDGFLFSFIYKMICI